MRGRRGSALAACGSALWLAQASACFSPDIPTGLPCSADHDCPSGQTCDLTANTCVPDSAIATWRDDTATDFTDPTAVLEDATIEANGAVAPAPYFVEGTAVFGIAAPAIGAGGEATTSWDDIAARPRTGRGFSRSLDLNFTEPPAGTGLTAATGITVLVKGEIYLDAGTRTFELQVDDRGFFELGDPATLTFTRVVASNVGPPDRGTATVAADGWYPFRGAFENTSGSTKYELRVDTPDDSSPIDTPPDRIRIRVDDVTGLALDGFKDIHLETPTGTALSQVGLEAQDYGVGGYPPDVGDLGNAEWTARWSGQVLVTVGGKYTFRLDTEGGHRMWVDGVLIADAFSGPPVDEMTTPVDLDPGWHDVVIDLLKWAGSSDPTHLHLTIADGPELVGAFFPVDRMRPVPGRAARWAYVGNNTALGIPDTGDATRDLTPILPAGASAVLEDIDFGVTHPVLSSLGISLSAPSTSFTIEMPGELSGAGAHTDHLRYDGLAAAGTWHLTATDTVNDVMTGRIDFVRLAITYAGGTPPFPTRAVYTSRVRELGDVVSISGVRWQSRQETGAGRVQVRVRSCDLAEACAAEPWHDIARSGDAAGVPARAFLQYQIEITDDGDVPTALDWIEIDYRLPG